MYRLLACTVVIFWLTAMSALFMRDVWPAWTAQDPPTMTAEQFAAHQQKQRQLGIFNAKGKRLGTAWSEITTPAGNMNIDGTVLIGGLGVFPPIRVETQTQFDTESRLDSFEMNVLGIPNFTIKAKGERRGIYFPCELQVGVIRRQANLDLSASRMIGESLQPFSYLPDLKVGQAWRMQMLDPVSAVMSSKANFTAVIARVTGKETIEHDGQKVECFVVETRPQQVKAWVDQHGQVLMQRANLPVIGTLTLKAETYDEQARRQAREDIRHQ